jgi:hypothetical protein
LSGSHGKACASVPVPARPRFGAPRPWSSPGEARRQVAAPEQQAEDDPGTHPAPTGRAQAARERREHIEAALERLPGLAEIKARQGKPRVQARTYTTDAEATLMKTGDGGFRPGHNARYATGT